jgi:AcrR family transcriptional regulator
MARPRSEDKRKAILNAAAGAVAEMGVGAPTAKIAKLAGVAEGTLFTYFSSKDELLNQLYLKLKADLSDAMTSGYPVDQSLVERSRHVWSRFVGWGSAHPLRRKAMSQLAVSDRITEKTRKIAGEAFTEISAMIRESLAGGALKHQPPAFAAAIMSAMADTTMEFIAREPGRAKHYTKAGFEAFWKAVTK